MSDTNSSISPATQPAGGVALTVEVAAVLAATTTKVNLPDFFAAMGNPVHWEMVKVMAV
jgi:hypothetical protein